MSLKIFTPEQNPAKTLYHYWLSILKGWAHDELLSNRPHIAFGEPNCRIGVHAFDGKGRPILALSYAGTDRFILRGDGAFRLGYLSANFNSHARQRVWSNTFLDYNHDFGEYHWNVHTGTFPPRSTGQARLERPDLPNGDKWYGYLPIYRDWRQPVPYAPESFLGARLWNEWHKPWMSCVPDEEFHWRLEPARVQVDSIEATFRKNLPGRWTHFQELRVKRYGAAQRGYEIDAGLRPPPPPRSMPTEVTEAMVAQFAAAFDLDEPATTTPLARGPKEAQHGHDVVAQEQLEPTILPAR